MKKRKFDIERMLPFVFLVSVALMAWSASLFRQPDKSSEWSLNGSEEVLRAGWESTLGLAGGDQRTGGMAPNLSASDLRKLVRTHDAFERSFEREFGRLLGARSGVGNLEVAIATKR